MDIAFWSTLELAAAIRNASISATEVLEAQLAQIERHNPALDAVVILDAEAARERAAENRHGGRRRRLRGSPMLKSGHKGNALEPIVESATSEAPEQFRSSAATIGVME